MKNTEAPLHALPPARPPMPSPSALPPSPALEKRVAEDLVELHLQPAGGQGPAQALMQALLLQRTEFLAVHDLGPEAALPLLLTLSQLSGWPVQRLLLKTSVDSLPLAELPFLDLPLPDRTLRRIFATPQGLAPHDRDTLARVVLACSRLAVLTTGPMPRADLARSLAPWHQAMVRGPWPNHQLVLVPLGQPGDDALTHRLQEQAAFLVRDSAVQVHVAAPAPQAPALWAAIATGWNALHGGTGSARALPLELARVLPPRKRSGRPWESAASALPQAPLVPVQPEELRPRVLSTAADAADGGPAVEPLMPPTASVTDTGPAAAVEPAPARPPLPPGAGAPAAAWQAPGAPATDPDEARWRAPFRGASRIPPRRWTAGADDTVGAREAAAAGSRPASADEPTAPTAPVASEASIGAPDSQAGSPPTPSDTAARVAASPAARSQPAAPRRPDAALAPQGAAASESPAGPWADYLRRCMAIKGAQAAAVLRLPQGERLAAAGSAPDTTTLAALGGSLSATLSRHTLALGLGSALPMAAYSTGTHHLLLQPVPGHPDLAVHLVLLADGSNLMLARMQLERIAVTPGE